MTTGTRRLSGLLEHADAALRATPTSGAADGEAAPDQGLGSFIRLSLDDPCAAQLLLDAAAQLNGGKSTDLTAAAILDHALVLTGAELGTVHVVEPATQELRIVAQAGFDQEFLDHFAVVDDDTSACGRAAAQHAQTVIADVDTDEDFAPHRDIAAASKFRAVQSTPLIDADGSLVGVVSTHFPQPSGPTERTLKVTRLYGLVAGEALGRTLTRPARAGSGPSSTLTRMAVIDLTDTIVRSLLSAGLSLTAAQSLIGDGAAGDRVAEAIDELDQALGGIRSAVLELLT